MLRSTRNSSENKKPPRVLDLLGYGKTDMDWVDEAFENSSMVRHNVILFPRWVARTEVLFYLSLSPPDNDEMIKWQCRYFGEHSRNGKCQLENQTWLEVGTNNQIEHYKNSVRSRGQ